MTGDQHRHLEQALALILVSGLSVGAAATKLWNSNALSFLSAFVVSAMLSAAFRRFFGKWAASQLQNNEVYAGQIKHWFSALWRPIVPFVVGIAFISMSFLYSSAIFAGFGGALIGFTLAFFVMKSIFDFQGNTHERTS